MPRSVSRLVLAEYEHRSGARLARIERRDDGWLVWRWGEGAGDVPPRIEVPTESQAKRVARAWVRGA